MLHQNQLFSEAAELDLALNTRKQKHDMTVIQNWTEHYIFEYAHKLKQLLPIW